MGQRAPPPPLLLVVLAASIASAYIEVVEESGCQDASLRLTCRHLDATVAILHADFTPDSSACGSHNHSASVATGSTSSAQEGNDTREYTVRPAINRRCSGRHTCSFVLAEDCPESLAWGPGRLSIKYACRDGANTTRACGATVLAEASGFVQTPGYPSYYVGQQTCLWTLKAPPGRRLQVDMLDVSLRSKGATEMECTDSLRVWEGVNVLMDTCGEQPSLLQLLSKGDTINVSVTAKSKMIHPKRGVLFHYRTVGCGEPPPAPDDGYRVYRNETYALYMCCVGFAFADTHEHDRALRCAANGTWLPQEDLLCVNSNFNPLLAMKLNAADNNSTGYEVAAVVKESDLVVDVLLPTMIICVLLVGNGVIIFVIFYLRKRKLPREGDEEELGAICQQQDGGSVSDKAICV